MCSPASPELFSLDIKLEVKRLQKLLLVIIA